MLLAMAWIQAGSSGNPTNEADADEWTSFPTGEGTNMTSGYTSETKK